MKKNIVLITTMVRTHDQAQKILQDLLDKHLAQEVQIQEIASHSLENGKIKKEHEVQVMIKTQTDVIKKTRTSPRRRKFVAPGRPRLVNDVPVMSHNREEQQQRRDEYKNEPAHHQHQRRLQQQVSPIADISGEEDTVRRSPFVHFNENARRPDNVTSIEESRAHAV